MVQPQSSQERKKIDCRTFDIDGDGILDKPCPDWDEKAPYFDLSSFLFLRLPDYPEHAKWQSAVNFDIAKAKSNEITVEYAIIAINSGNTQFVGNVDFYNHMPGVLNFNGVKLVEFVDDQRELKKGLAMIPYVGLVTLGMQDFSSVSQYSGLRVSMNNSILTMLGQNLTLPPKRGLRVVFEVRYVLPGSTTEAVTP